MNDVKEMPKKEEVVQSAPLQENRYSFSRVDVTRENMMHLDEISEDIFETFRKYDLTIWEAKTLLPYLVSKIAEEARDTEIDIIEYMDTYLKPASIEFYKGLRNFRKFSETKFPTRNTITN